MPLDPESVALAEIARVDLDAVPFDPVVVDELPDGRLRFRLAEEILP